MSSDPFKFPEEIVGDGQGLNHLNLVCQETRKLEFVLFTLFGGSLGRDHHEGPAEGVPREEEAGEEERRQRLANRA